MWPFHTHCLELIATTYAPPFHVGTSLSGPAEETMDLIKAARCGQTTFVWKCSSEDCPHIVKVKAYGKVQEP